MIRTAKSLNKKPFTSNAIKIIAIIAMTIDHTATVCFPRYSTSIILIAMHLIGRLTAPIMIFCIVEGYYHTHNLRKYISRLFILAIISHFAYALAFQKDLIPLRQGVFDQTSIIWGLMLGLIALEVHEDKKLNLKTWQKHLIITACIIFAFPADWSSPGALAILYMGIYNDSMKKKMAALIVCIAMYSIVYAICLNTLYGIMQMGIVLAIPLLYGYNGKRGKWKGMKWLFYIYYPAHLTILGLIRIFLLKRAMN